MPTIEEQLEAIRQRQARAMQLSARLREQREGQDRAPPSFHEQHIDQVESARVERAAQEFEQARVTRRMRETAGLSAPGLTVIPEAGARIFSTAARGVQLATGGYVGGEEADRLSRLAELFSQGQAEILEESAVPEWAKRATRITRGVGSSATTVAALGGAGSAPLIAGQAAVAANDALAQARGAGLSDGDSMLYALGTGAIEGVVTAAFQRLGLGGLEQAFAKTAAEGARIFARDLAKRAAHAGIQLAAEEVEELSIAVLQDSLARYQGVEKPTPQEFAETLTDTAIQTGLLSGPANAIEAFRRGPPPAADTALGDRARQLVEEVSNATAPKAPVLPEAPPVRPDTAEKIREGRPVSYQDLAPVGVGKTRLQERTAEVVAAVQNMEEFQGARVREVGQNGSVAIRFPDQETDVALVLAAPTELARLMATNPENSWSSLGIPAGGTFTGRTGKTYTRGKWLSASVPVRTRELAGSIQGGVVMDPANDPLFPGVDTVVYLTSGDVDAETVLRHESAHRAFGRRASTAELQTLAQFREEIGRGPAPPGTALREGAFQEQILADVYLPWLRGEFDTVQTRSAEEARTVMQRIRDWFARLLGIAKSKVVVDDRLMAEASRILNEVRQGTMQQRPAAEVLPSRETLVRARGTDRAKRVKEAARIQAAPDEARRRVSRAAAGAEAAPLEAEARVRRAQTGLERARQGEERAEIADMRLARQGAQEAQRVAEAIARESNTEVNEAEVTQDAVQSDEFLRRDGAAELALELSRVQDIARQAEEAATDEGVRGMAGDLLLKLHRTRKLAASLPAFARPKALEFVASMRAEAQSLLQQARGEGEASNDALGMTMIRSILPTTLEGRVKLNPHVNAPAAQRIAWSEEVAQGQLLFEMLGGANQTLNYAERVAQAGRDFTRPEHYALSMARARIEQMWTRSLRRSGGASAALTAQLEKVNTLAARGRSEGGRTLNFFKTFMEESPGDRVHHLRERVQRLSPAEASRVAKVSRERGEEAGAALQAELQALRWAQYENALERAGITWDMLLSGAADDGAWGMAHQIQRSIAAGLRHRLAAAASIISRNMALSPLGAARVATITPVLAGGELAAMNLLAISGAPSTAGIGDTLRGDAAALAALWQLPRAVASTLRSGSSWALTQIGEDPGALHREAVERGGAALTQAETLFGPGGGGTRRLARGMTEVIGRLYGVADQLAQVPLSAFLTATMPHAVARERGLVRGTPEYDRFVSAQASFETRDPGVHDRMVQFLKDAGAQRPFSSRGLGKAFGTMESFLRRSESPSAQLLAGVFFPVFRGAVRGGEQTARWAPGVGAAAAVYDFWKMSQALRDSDADPTEIATLRARGMLQLSRTALSTLVIPAMLGAFLDEEELRAMEEGEIAGVNLRRIPFIGTLTQLYGSAGAAWETGDPLEAFGTLNQSASMVMREIIPGRRLLAPFIFANDNGLLQVMSTTPIGRWAVETYEAEDAAARLRAFLENVGFLRDFIRLQEGGVGEAFGVE